jgi:uncharacterized protein (DUF58 family)
MIKINIINTQNLWLNLSKVLFFFLLFANFHSNASQRLIEDDTLRFSYPKDTILLGKVNEGDVITKAFTITNNYNENVVVNQVYPSCGCTTTQTEGFVLKPNQSKEIDFKFNATGMDGTYLKSLIIITDRGAFTVNFKVSVGDSLIISE